MMSATTIAKRGRSSQNKAPRNAAISAAAVRSRVKNKRSGVGRRWQRREAALARGGRRQLLARAAEAALARPVRGECRLEGLRAEIRPERLGEMQLRVGELPQQEVADALLAA